MPRKVEFQEMTIGDFRVSLATQNSPPPPYARTGAGLGALLYDRAALTVELYVGPALLYAT